MLAGIASALSRILFTFGKASQRRYCYGFKQDETILKGL
jgi:hypothetical protein